MKFEPLGARVLVLPDPTTNVSKGGVIKVVQTEDKQTVGTVVATGPGQILTTGEWMAMTVVVGDRVAYGKYGGTPMKVDDVEYQIVNIDQVMGVFRE